MRIPSVIVSTLLASVLSYVIVWFIYNEFSWQLWNEQSRSLFVVLIIGFSTTFEFINALKKGT